MQCHPTQPVVATSGIESVVKLWSPDGPADGLDAVGASLRVNRNQERMSSQTYVSRGINQRLLAVSCCRHRACPVTPHASAEQACRFQEQDRYLPCANHVQN